MNDDRPYCILVVKSDPAALRTGTRRLMMLVSAGFTLCLLMFGSVFALCLMYPAQSSDVRLSAFPSAIGILVVMWMAVIGAIHLFNRYLAKATHVDLGDDFLAAPAIGRMTVTTPIIRFSGIGRVHLDISKGRITGGIVAAKIGVSIRNVKEPATIVRTIFERTGPEVKWQRSFASFHSRLSRDQVQELIENSGGKDIDALLPPGAAYVTAEELHGEAARQVACLDFDPPSPAERYVNCILAAMAREGASPRTLRRSEPLPPIILAAETIKPIALDEAVSRLKVMCGLKPRAYRKPVDGIMNLTIVEYGSTPFRFRCHFDDKSDACCEIRLDTVEIEKNK
jgi:hypothetical protein